MSEIALKLNLWVTTTQNFSEFIDSSETREKTESVFEKLLIKLNQIFKSTTSSNLSSENKQGFWSKYDSEFQNDFEKVRTVWLQGINPQTRQIKSLKTLNQGYQEFKSFLEKYWSDLTIEDRQQFKDYAQSILEITEFAKRKFTERNKSDMIELILVLNRLINTRRLIMLLINFFTLKKSSQEAENNQNSVFNFIDTQADFANTVLDLYINSWENIEALWTEKDPKIIEAAQKKLDEQRLAFLEGKKIRKVYRQRGKEKEYNYLTQQSYLFYQNLPELIKTYPGLYVWFEDGEIKDTDYDRLTLCSRVVKSDSFHKRKINAIYVNQVPELN